MVSVLDSIKTLVPRECTKYGWLRYQIMAGDPLDLCSINAAHAKGHKIVPKTRHPEFKNDDILRQSDGYNCFINKGLVLVEMEISIEDYLRELIHQIFEDKEQLRSGPDLEEEELHSYWRAKTLMIHQCEQRLMQFIKYLKKFFDHDGENKDEGRISLFRTISKMIPKYVQQGIEEKNDIIDWLMEVLLHAFHHSKIPMESMRAPDFLESASLGDAFPSGKLPPGLEKLG